MEWFLLQTHLEDNVEGDVAEAGVDELVGDGAPRLPLEALAVGKWGDDAEPGPGRARDGRVARQAFLRPPGATGDGSAQLFLLPAWFYPREGHSLFRLCSNNDNEAFNWCAGSE